MSSELNFAELPVEVLLHIFGKIDREETKPSKIVMSSELNFAEVWLHIFGKIDREETKPASIRTTLRLVCRRINNVIIDPTNQRRLSAIRMKAEKITIARFGSSFQIGVFLKTSEEQTANRVLIDPEIPQIQSRGDTLVRWGSRILPCGGNEELFEKFTHIISQFEPRRLELARIDITRSFMASMIECLRGYPRIQCLNFGFNTTCMNVHDYKENINGIESQFKTDIDVGVMAKFASNFHSLIRIPKRFVTSEFIEIWTTGPDTGEFDFFEPIEHNEELSSISLFNFHRFCFFESWKLITTLAELINAIERRIKIGKFKWQISLSDDEREIRTFTQSNNLNYK
ncbi:hypothetical protein PRIPAC_86817, partial [Pristionchus pacificus]|uniref:Uncharacterized protein n=1 Tax=Pristionchus pacificus TaxID=54126 RepID=A0A2A6BKA4_PRIPA